MENRKTFTQDGNGKAAVIDYRLCTIPIRTWLYQINKQFGRGETVASTYKITITRNGTCANGTITTRWSTLQGFRYGSIRFDIVKGQLFVKLGRRKYEVRVRDLLAEVNA